MTSSSAALTPWTGLSCQSEDDDGGALKCTASGIGAEPDDQQLVISQRRDEEIKGGLCKLRNEKWQAINLKWLIVNNTLIPHPRDVLMVLSDDSQLNEMRSERYGGNGDGYKWRNVWVGIRFRIYWWVAAIRKSIHSILFSDWKRFLALGLIDWWNRALVMI